MKSFNRAQKREIAVLFMIQCSVGIGFALGGDLKTGISSDCSESLLSLSLFLSFMFSITPCITNKPLFIQDATLLPMNASNV